MLRAEKTHFLVGSISSVTDQAEIHAGQHVLDLKSFRHKQDSCAVVTFQHPETRAPSITLAVVADGSIYNPEHGKRASSLAVELMLKQFDQAQAADDVLGLLRKGFEFASQHIAHEFEGEKLLDQGVATCAVAVVVERRLYIASVGNCRIFYLRKGNTLQKENFRQISVAHTLAERLLEHGHVKAPEDFERHSIDGPLFYRCLGEPRTSSEPDFRLRLNSEDSDEQALKNQGVRLRANDQIILCTGGLYGQYILSAELKQLKETLLQFDDPQEAVKRIEAALRQRGTIHNITLVVLKVPEE